jgi:hypothetical protein
MTRVEWEGIPERYWPDTEKPWRVSWGFGCHEDFATEEEAASFAKRQRDEFIAERGGWEDTVNGPFNAAEINR